MSTNSRKTIIGLSTCMALEMTSFVMIQPLFARRFTELGAGVEALGISAMAYALTGTMAAPIMGTLADRFGRRPLVLLSLAMNVAASCGYLIAGSAAAFIVLRGSAGALTAGLIPAVTGLAVDQAPDNRQAQWIGLVNAGSSVGWIAGPIAGGTVYDHWGYSAALTASIITAFIALLIAVLYVPESRVADIRPSARTAHPATNSIAKSIEAWVSGLRSTFPDPLSSFLLLLFVFFAVAFAWAFIEPRFMFYAYNDLGWSSSMLGFMMSTYGVALMLGEISLGQLSDRVGRKPVILIGLALFSAQFIGLAFLRNFYWIAAAFVISGLGNALYDPALSASILDISPVKHRARILGIKSMVGSSGAILGPGLVALLSASVDARSIFLVAVGVVLLTTVIGLGHLAGDAVGAAGAQTVDEPVDAEALLRPS